MIYQAVVTATKKQSCAIGIKVTIAFSFGTWLLTGTPVPIVERGAIACICNIDSHVGNYGESHKQIEGAAKLTLP